MNNVELSIITTHLSLSEYINVQCAMKTQLSLEHYTTFTAYKESVKECGGKDVSTASRMNVPIDNEILSYLVRKDQTEYLKRIPNIKNNNNSNWELQNWMIDKMPQELILYLIKKCI